MSTNYEGEGTGDEESLAFGPKYSHRSSRVPYGVYFIHHIPRQHECGRQHTRAPRASTPQAIVSNPGRIRHQLGLAARSLPALESVVVDTYVRRWLQVGTHWPIRKQLGSNELGLDRAEARRVW